MNNVYIINYVDVNVVLHEVSFEGCIRGSHFAEPSRWMSVRVGIFELYQGHSFLFEDPSKSSLHIFNPYA